MNKDKMEIKFKIRIEQARLVLIAIDTLLQDKTQPVDLIDDIEEEINRFRQFEKDMDDLTEEE